MLAHEFGHFGQRSMAVGRWVYIAQQIAGHIIAKRDALDSFLRGLSRIDLRIAWVGWLLSLIVWSIRSLMETVFRIVVLAQRALSREMELQADLVAVSLTGSDALIHALHKLNVADEAWERALAFADSEAREKRSVSDLFAVQKHITDEAPPRARRSELRRGRAAAQGRAAGASRVQDLARAAAAHVEHASGELGARAERQAPVHSGADRRAQRLGAVRRRPGSQEAHDGARVPRRARKPRTCRSSNRSRSSTSSSAARTTIARIAARISVARWRSTRATSPSSTVRRC